MAAEREQSLFGHPPDVEAQLARIDELLATGRYEWARETLEGIAGRLAVQGFVSFSQREAIRHIIAGSAKRRGAGK
jgi:hypothetical protein